MIGTEDYQISSQDNNFVPVDFSKMRIGVKTVSDAVLQLGDLRRANPRLADKMEVLRAIHSLDL